MNDFTIDGTSFYTFLDFIAKHQKASTIRFTGYGTSMTPFIRNGNTLTIKLIDKNDKIKKGTVVAVKHIEKKIIIHRIIGIKNNYFQIKGDNRKLQDGWYPKESIIGVITEIKRESGKRVQFPTWQNFIIAFLSKTRILNFLILPVGRWIKHNI